MKKIRIIPEESVKMTDFLDNTHRKFNEFIIQFPIKKIFTCEYVLNDSMQEDKIIESITKEMIHRLCDDAKEYILHDGFKYIPPQFIKCNNGLIRVIMKLIIYDFDIKLDQYWLP